MANKRISSRSVVHALTNQLQRYAHELVETGQVPRFFVSFLRYDKRIQPSVLTTPDWLIQLRQDDQGLLGAAIEENATKTWDIFRPSDEDTHFIKGDKRTVFEIVFPLLIDGGITAVGMVDYFDGEMVKTPEEILVEASEWQQQIGQIIAAPQRLEDELNERLIHYVGDCVKATKSLRGYVAFEHWSGSPIYIAEGQDHDKFLPLSLDVGIVGEAFHRGDMINEGNVWRRPGYVPSDDRIASELVLPVELNNRVVGVLNLEAVSENHYSENIVRSAQAFALKISSLADEVLNTHSFEEEEELVVLGRHIQKTLRPSKLNLPTLRRDELIDTSLKRLEASVSQISEVSSVKLLWADMINDRPGHIFSEQFLAQISNSSKPFIAVRGKTKSVLFGLKVSEQLVAILEAELEDAHGLTVTDSIKLLAHITISEIERRIENQRRFAIEPFLERVSNLNRLDDVFIMLPEFLREYLDCDEALILSNFRIDKDRIFQVLCAVPEDGISDNFPFTQKETKFSNVAKGRGLLADVASSNTIELSQRPKYSGRAKVDPGANDAGPEWSISPENTRSLLVFSISPGIGISSSFVVRLARSTSVGSAPFNNHDIEKVSMVKKLLEKMFPSPQTLS